MRERNDDIPLLADFFLKKYSKKYDKEGCKFDLNALREIKKHHWPGNVRELQNTIEKAVILSEGMIIGTEDLFLNKTKGSPKSELPKTFSEIEKQAIEKALRNNDGSVSKAAIELDLARQTLYNKMVKYNL